MKLVRWLSIRRPVFPIVPSQYRKSSLTHLASLNIIHSRLFSNATNNSKRKVSNQDRLDCKHEVVQQIISTVKLQTNDIEFFTMPRACAVPLLFRYVEDDIGNPDEEKLWCGLNVRSRMNRLSDGRYQFSNIDDLNRESSLLCKLPREDVVHYFPPGEPPVTMLCFAPTGKYTKYCTRMDNLAPNLLESWSTERLATREKWLCSKLNPSALGVATLMKKVYRPLGIDVSFPNSSDPLCNAILSSEFGSYRVRHQTAVNHLGYFRCEWQALYEDFKRKSEDFFDLCIAPVEQNSIVRGFFAFPKTVFRERFLNHCRTPLYPPFQDLPTRKIAFVKEEKKWQEQFYVNMAGGVDFDKFRKILKMSSG